MPEPVRASGAWMQRLDPECPVCDTTITGVTARAREAEDLFSAPPPAQMTPDPCGHEITGFGVEIATGRLVDIAPADRQPVPFRQAVCDVMARWRDQVRDSVIADADSRAASIGRQLAALRPSRGAWAWAAVAATGEEFEEQRRRAIERMAAAMDLPVDVVRATSVRASAAYQDDQRPYLDDPVQRARLAIRQAEEELGHWDGVNDTAMRWSGGAGVNRAHP